MFSLFSHLFFSQISMISNNFLMLVILVMVPAPSKNWGLWAMSRNPRSSLLEVTFRTLSSPACLGNWLQLLACWSMWPLTMVVLRLASWSGTRTMAWWSTTCLSPALLASSSMLRRRLVFIFSRPGFKNSNIIMHVSWFTMCSCVSNFLGYVQFHCLAPGYFSRCVHVSQVLSVVFRFIVWPHLPWSSGLEGRESLHGWCPSLSTRTTSCTWRRQCRSEGLRVQIGCVWGQQHQEGMGEVQVHFAFTCEKHVCTGHRVWCRLASSSTGIWWEVPSLHWCFMILSCFLPSLDFGVLLCVASNPYHIYAWLRKRSFWQPDVNTGWIRKISKSSRAWRVKTFLLKKKPFKMQGLVQTLQQHRDWHLRLLQLPIRQFRKSTGQTNHPRLTASWRFTM